MFGGGKKKDRRSRPPGQPSRGRENLEKLGLFDIPDPDAIAGCTNDADLEKELEQLMSGGIAGARPKKRGTPTMPQSHDLDSVVADIMEDKDVDLSDGDENDQSLLDELEGLAGDGENDDDDNDVVVGDLQRPPPSPTVMMPLSASAAADPLVYASADLTSVIDERIWMYTQAERAAKDSGDSTKARRYTRGLANLTDLRWKVKSGKPVSEDDIPPPVVAPKSHLTTPRAPAAPDAAAAQQPLPPQPMSNETRLQTPTPLPSTLRPSASVSSSATNVQLLSLIQQRREECKAMALKGKHEGDKMTAVMGMRAMKACNELMDRVKSGDASVTIDSMPSLPIPGAVDTARADMAAACPPTPPSLPERQISKDEPIEMPENLNDLPPADPALFGAPPPPKTTEEALTQRLEKFRKDEVKAKEEGNSSRARRLGRICKQYEDAVRINRAGKPFGVDDLPTPPGYAPIPVNDPAETDQQPARPAAFPATAAAAAGAAASNTAAASNPAAVKRKAPPMTQTEKNVKLLMERQVLFRQAALEAKKAGNVEEAREYLRQFKGFDKLIESAKGGRPVDFNTLPVPPQQIRGEYKIN
jgi:coiled-coil and C2 domain-containing protein 1